MVTCTLRTLGWTGVEGNGKKEKKRKSELRIKTKKDRKISLLLGFSGISTDMVQVLQWQLYISAGPSVVGAMHEAPKLWSFYALLVGG